MLFLLVLLFVCVVFSNVMENVSRVLLDKGRVKYE